MSRSVGFMALNEMMRRFRVASRELFNHYFRVSMVARDVVAVADVSAADDDDPWDVVDRFSHVEDVLFEELVSGPAKLTHVSYGDLQPEILVEVSSDFCPIMLNREVESGYWDFPIHEVTREARLLFFRFFDWDRLDYHDNQYVVVQVADWPAHPEAVGKKALIESRYVHFLSAVDSDDTPS
jgi:hypothetical protein